MNDTINALVTLITRYYLKPKKGMIEIARYLCSLLSPKECAEFAGIEEEIRKKNRNSCGNCCNLDPYNAKCVISRENIIDNNRNDECINHVELFSISAISRIMVIVN